MERCQAGALGFSSGREEGSSRKVLFLVFNPVAGACGFDSKETTPRMGPIGFHQEALPILVICNQ